MKIYIAEVNIIGAKTTYYGMYFKTFFSKVWIDLEQPSIDFGWKTLKNIEEYCLTKDIDVIYEALEKMIAIRKLKIIRIIETYKV